ncbi:MAG: selenocysteine-specific translation elongation factor [Nitrospirota bacterium]
MPPPLDDGMDKTLKHIVVGTAGHVDHGKTALVKALTGVDTKRPEEKRRGMTIEPGFAPYTLPSGQRIAFIDVPGHESLIKNMIRGIWGIDVVILVVAADDGIMPQTREHLDILKLLGIKQGFVVLSKIDLVDEEVLEMAIEEIKGLTKDTFLEDSPIIPFSVKTGQGKAEIEQTLKTFYEKTLEKDSEGIFYMPIDRAFHKDGFGAIVTGTIASGTVKAGDVVEIHPTERQVKVRAIQVHHQKTDKAQAGERVGLNLRDVELKEIQRGIVISEVDVLRPSYFLNAHFHYLSSQTDPLKNRTRVRFYTGASKTNALIVFMDKEVMHPGETAFVQFRLSDKLAPLPFHRFIVRKLSPVATIGGGTILEIEISKYRKRDENKIQHLRLIIEGTDEELIEDILKRERHYPVGIKNFSQTTRLSTKRILEILTSLQIAGKTIFLGNERFFHKENYEALKDQLLNILKEFREKNPLEVGISKDEVKSSYLKDLDHSLFNYVIEDMAREKPILSKGGILRLVDFDSRLNPVQETIRQKIIEFAGRSGLNPFTLNTLLMSMDHFDPHEVQKVVTYLRKTGYLIFIKQFRYSNRQIYIRRETLDQIKKTVKEYILSHGQIDINRLRELSGIGRNSAISILDYLDSIQFTLRIGDTHILSKTD